MTTASNQCCKVPGSCKSELLSSMYLRNCSSDLFRTWSQTWSALLVKFGHMMLYNLCLPSLDSTSKAESHPAIATQTSTPGLRVPSSAAHHRAAGRRIPRSTTQPQQKMSLSRNGTLEKAVSELGSPSRAGSGVVVPPPYSLGGSEAADTPLELRGSLDCWACSVLVTAQNLIIALIQGGLASVIFGIILTPALAMIIFGFLCHSTVQPHGTTLYCSDILDDTGCVALLVVGFLLLTPLLVLALAAYCRLARHLQLGMCFIPYSRAVYKNMPRTRDRKADGGGCCGQQGASDREGKGSVWV